MTRTHDAWGFGIDLILSTHDRLSLPSSPESVSERTGARMRERYLEGLALAGRLKPPPLGPSSELSTEEHLIVGAFLLGAATRSVNADGRAETKEEALIGCGASKHLVHAVLQLRTRQRRTIFWQMNGAKYNELQRSLAGCYSEAHVAAVFLAAGQTVLASTTEEDVNLGVDLIVPFADPSRGMAVQVKTARDQLGVMFRHLDATDTDPSDPQADLYAKIIEKVRTFNRNLGVAYEPVIAFAGIDDVSRFHFDHATNVPYVRAFVDALTATRPPLGP